MQKESLGNQLEGPLFAIGHGRVGTQFVEAVQGSRCRRERERALERHQGRRTWLGWYGMDVRAQVEGYTFRQKQGGILSHQRFHYLNRIMQAALERSKKGVDWRTTEHVCERESLSSYNTSITTSVIPQTTHIERTEYKAAMAKSFMVSA